MNQKATQDRNTCKTGDHCFDARINGRTVCSRCGIEAPKPKTLVFGECQWCGHAKVVGDQCKNTLCPGDPILKEAEPEKTTTPGSQANLEAYMREVKSAAVQSGRALNTYSPDQWSALLSSTIVQIQSLAALKGGEYSGDTDRLANFRRNGQALGLDMTQIWGVYAAKHWDAIIQAIKDWASGKDRTRLEPLSGRADDLIVYLLLFKAMLEERGEK